MAKLISVVVPMFNEEAVLDGFFARIVPVLDGITERFGLNWEIVAVDDGSRDTTADRLKEIAAANPAVTVVLLARNFGKEAAMTAGLEHARGDAVIPIDVDLQDPPEVMDEFVQRWFNGAEMVVGIRLDRSADTPVKRTTSRLFYQLFNLLCRPGIPENAGDFRLMDRVVVDAVLRLRETNRFMKGLFAWVGFKTEYVEFVREKRSAGSSTWSYMRLLRFAIDGITGFSTVPLRMWSWLGFTIAILSFVYGVYFVVKALIIGDPVAGFPTLVAVILFLSGMQMIGLGVMGEYVGRLYMEAKQRPVYIAREVIRSRAETSASSDPDRT
ncbi:glycosyltransferase family 2 protein [Kaistia dalseonensis]|uniref:Glycosyltransferase involved in cell wall biosynthesis n=1 Tax=Kaistia dalseonensis TaxID=410840 RepID=A0ABU0H2A0_9HYPH|nr:glycosyltransferase family 2 protein [Kaistia dalseonensis]MCX5493866.1 glycosyltransferase family 2 protein [Kaistia dalseonensis]MDQ0436432.1 glycosyltransferase involved in cell wall biosynthesis [Kaistia dalseonensis]